MSRAERTSLVLDAATRQAARQLARHYDCSTSEAIRRAVLVQRDAAIGVTAEMKRGRKKVLERLFELFEDSDPEGEIRRLKSEDAGF